MIENRLWSPLRGCTGEGRGIIWGIYGLGLAIMETQLDTYSGNDMTTTI